MNVQLPTGKTISVSYFDYLFVLKEEDVDLFFQAAIAADEGIEIQNPFSNKSYSGRIEADNTEEIEEQSPENIGEINL